MKKSKYLETVTCLLMFSLSMIIKTYKVESGNFVVWDEAHFGKFSAKYLSRKFYFDVHPPLGKMLISLGGYIFSQPLDFEFKSGEAYPKTFDYSGMRRFHAFIASFTPLFGYLILKEIGFSYRRRLALSLMFVFENGFTSIGRLILLDSYLLTFTTAVSYFMTRLYFRSRFGTDTYSLFMLGLMLGCALSVKWIGFLTMSLVGVFTIYQLWSNITSKARMLQFFKMFASRALFLIALPLSVYVLLFYIHFQIVNHSSSDEVQMSSMFQASLKGNEISNNRKYPLYGTQVTIKSARAGGGYLHSHDHTYPGSINNQVTTYHHKDENNHWAFQKVTDDLTDANYILDGDIVILLHLETKMYLDVPGSMSLVSNGKRVETLSGTKILESCLFKVEVVEDALENENRLKTLTTKFRLLNTSTGCYLKASLKKYPSWGFGQGEVTCTPNPEESSLWNVAECRSDKLDEDKNPIYSEAAAYPFMKKFIEHNKAMFVTNASFIQDDSLEPERSVSRPYEWFILKRGLRMTSWSGSKEKFYMFGNPFTWYSSSICIIASPIILLCRVIGKKRSGMPVKFLKTEGFFVFLSCCGWFLHYIPFFFVKRVLYFHHYYPALFFGLLSICYVSKFLEFRFTAFFISIAIASFLIYSQSTYGFVQEPKILRMLKLVPTWDFTDTK
ncbi:dolichyl-phosphate-mannose-protein [Ordospora colligata]|uniref:Dolichyl-phosphate-mannose--protein mannosyltransferase n=1 Tax=Ordospora colligata OC4 TaxID=1354746 RepID=A0A0B2ULV2_9MICR|nr:dolichyl-phosphate-mannose-protein [Ordospora colligata OC4]KHN70288.1 dolichyl-phosphate-mannose-protein [Ordospora colligata OC4]TBU16832.1 dolichyl-phosphate-mannose-protein [Ordospora colligata]TBU19381.1 dolichyl-phosphate-mannose-protein [Ordospora colligata]